MLKIFLLVLFNVLHPIDLFHRFINNAVQFSHLVLYLLDLRVGYFDLLFSVELQECAFVHVYLAVSILQLSAQTCSFDLLLFLLLEILLFIMLLHFHFGYHLFLFKFLGQFLIYVFQLFSQFLIFSTQVCKHSIFFDGWFFICNIHILRWTLITTQSHILITTSVFSIN